MNLRGNNTLSLYDPDRDRDYFVAVTQEGGGPDCFGWELRHTGKHRWGEVRVHGFRSSEAAEVAGKTALAEFLEGLSVEESLGA